MTNEQKLLIDKIGKAAQEHYPKYKILPSLCISQAILESAWGRSSLSRLAHNYFGMKAGSSWKGTTYNSDTNEHTSAGVTFTINANFRAYANISEGIKGYYEFLKYDRYKNLVGVTDYKVACRLIKEDGWATDINYTKKLVSLIEDYGLAKYDKVGDNMEITKVKIKNLENGYGFEVKGVLIDGTNYVSARELMETFGFKVGWDDTTKTVTVNK